MSHHGFDGLPEDFKRSLLDTTSFRGALGTFPEGRLTKGDEGALQFGVTERDGKVVLDFGAPVAWVGMNPQQAADLASLMLSSMRGRLAEKPVRSSRSIWASDVRVASPNPTAATAVASPGGGPKPGTNHND